MLVPQCDRLSPAPIEDEEKVKYGHPVHARNWCEAGRCQADFFFGFANKRLCYSLAWLDMTANHVPAVGARQQVCRAPPEQDAPLSNENGARALQHLFASFRRR